MDEAISLQTVADRVHDKTNVQFIDVASNQTWNPPLRPNRNSACLSLFCLAHPRCKERSSTFSPGKPDMLPLSYDAAFGSVVKWSAAFEDRLSPNSWVEMRGRRGAHHAPKCKQKLKGDESVRNWPHSGELWSRGLCVAVVHQTCIFRFPLLCISVSNPPWPQTYSHRSADILDGWSHLLLRPFQSRIFTTGRSADCRLWIFLSSVYILVNPQTLSTQLWLIFVVLKVLVVRNLRSLFDLYFDWINPLP